MDEATNAPGAQNGAPAPRDNSGPASPPPTPIFIQQPAHPGRRLLTWIGWGGFLFCGFLLFNQWSARQDYYDVTRGIRERFHSGVEDGPKKVAIIRVRGVIMEGDGFVKRQIDRVRQDERVKAVVVRVVTPGGTVTGSDYIYHHLRKLREERDIPLVVSMGSIATSGGYYVSMSVGDQDRAIFAEPTTTTGSIGVIVPHYDITGLLAKFDIKEDSIASHPRKQMLSMTREISPEDRAIIRAYVDESFARFKEIIKSGRPELDEVNESDKLCDAKTGRDLATGEIFTATQAQTFGLVDEIGFVEDAIDRAIELAGLDKKQVRVVQYDRPPSLMGLVGIEANDPGFTIANWLELSAPRAFYLASNLPPLVSSRREP
jgi:protease-4